MSAPVLALTGVTDGAGGRTILDVPAFEVAGGETVALLGPNGAGKTTLLHVAALLRQPDGGDVRVQGEMAARQNAAKLRRRLSVVFQDPLLFDVSALANAAAGLRFQGIARGEAERRAMLWLERFGVGHLASQRARTLSGGEAARVALARAFATEPALLLLDEPFAALDPPTRAALLPALREELRQAGTAALLVTHDLDEAFACGDRLTVLLDGRIAASGAPGDLLDHPPSRAVATLLGIENILAATVVRPAGDSLLLALDASGPEICLPAPASAALHPGQAVTLTLPAAAVTALRLHETAPVGWITLPGRVATATTLSSGMRLVVATPVPIAAHAPWDVAGARWTAGEAAVVAFAARAAHIIAES